MGWEKAVKRELYSDTSLCQEARKNSDKEPNLPLKKQAKEETKLKVSRRKETIKIRAEINETETKRTTEKINETKSLFSEKINKTNKPLARFIREKEKWSNEKWKSISHNTTEIQKIKRDY